MTISATVKQYVEGRGIAYELTSHPVTGSSHESAEVAHVDAGHIAKAVILQDDWGTVMVVVPGDAWVKLSAVNGELDRGLKLAEEGDAARHFPDCDSGAIPPLGPAYGMETLLDEALASLAFVYFESGDHRNLLRVSGEGFLELLSGARRGHYCHVD
jgi:Ala-tRNA(Pro) deacylase